MFQVRPFESRTLSWWHQERDNLDMDPVYQRNSGLWSTYDKAFLIDSILNGFDISKLYIADFTYGNTTLNFANKAYAVIDGKQRFEAIFDFFDDIISLDQEFVFSEDSELELAGLGYKELAQKYPRIASKFSNYNLSVASVITDDEFKINEMFVRLNKNKPLTGAEIRNAMKGVVPESTRKIAGHKFFTSRIRFNVARGQDKNASTKLLLIEYLGDFTDTKKVQLNDFVEQGIRSESYNIEGATARVLDTLDSMSAIFENKDILLTSPASIIIYYWLVRNTSQDERNYVREYLLRFDRARKANRKIAKEFSGNANPSLLLYDTLNRSPDDQKSLQRRYFMLLQGLRDFILGSTNVLPPNIANLS